MSKPLFTALFTEMQEKLEQLPVLLKDLPEAERKKIVEHYEASIDYLEFVEKWAVYHAQHISPKECLEGIQWYPVTMETTTSYTEEKPRPAMKKEQAESLIRTLTSKEPAFAQAIQAMIKLREPSPGGAFSWHD